MEPLDHRWIDEQGAAEAYVLGRLSAAEEASFEEHLLVCRECRDRVSAVEGLRGSLAALAHEETAEAAEAAVARLPLLAVWARQALRWGLVAALLAVTALASWLLLERHALRRELAGARAASEQVPNLAAERDRLRAEESRLSAELTDAQRERTSLGERLAVLARPQLHTVILSLGVARGGQPPGRVLLGPEPEWLVLAIEAPSPERDTYSVTLLDPQGRAVFQGAGLAPNVEDNLVVSLSSTLLAPGAYRLLLQGTAGRAKRVEIPLAVARRP